MTHFCNAQCPDFMSGIPEIAQKTLLKWCRNENQQTGYPAEIHILLSQQLKRPFALLSGAPDSYSIWSTCIYGQTFPGAQNSSCLPSHWHSVSAIRKDNKNQYYSEPTLDGPFKTWHRCERVALILYGKRFLLTSCLLLFNISIFSMAFLDETLLLSLSNWRYNNDFEISM